LAKILALLFEKVAQPTDQRIVAQHGVLFLRDVLDEPEHQQSDQRDAENRSDSVRQNTHESRHQRLPAVSE
jgi:hypothetical protein